MLTKNDEIESRIKPEIRYRKLSLLFPLIKGLFNKLYKFTFLKLFCFIPKKKYFLASHKFFLCFTGAKLSFITVFTKHRQNATLSHFNILLSE